MFTVAFRRYARRGAARNLLDEPIYAGLLNFRVAVCFASGIMSSCEQWTKNIHKHSDNYDNN